MQLAQRSLRQFVLIAVATVLMEWPFRFLEKRINEPHWVRPLRIIDDEEFKCGL